MVPPKIKDLFHSCFKSFQIALVANYFCETLKTCVKSSILLAPMQFHVHVCTKVIHNFFIVSLFLCSFVVKQECGLWHLSDFCILLWQERRYYLPSTEDNGYFCGLGKSVLYYGTSESAVWTHNNYCKHY
jgi:hypothetical protein